jgi:hypothetical protein
MKNIKLFEAFSGFGGASKYLIGYFGTGGYGAHPGVVTSDELESNGWSESRPGSGAWGLPNGFYFDATFKSTEIPQALLCILYEGGEYKIDPISKEKADAIYNVGGTPDYFFDDFDLSAPVHGEIAQIKKILGIDNQQEITAISVIQDIEPNTIYWSDNPEQTHGYWEASDASPMSIQEFSSMY